MSSTPTFLTPALHQYILATAVAEPDVLRSCRLLTATLPGGHMQITPDQGQLLGLLVELLGARQILEIGTFTGYSSLAMALAQPPGGSLVTCDSDPEAIKIAQQFWQQAGIAHRITTMIGPALTSLAQLQADAREFDLVFIDADKQSYGAYYEAALTLLKKGGVILVDNTLMHGKVIDPSAQDNATRGIRAFNDKLRHDRRVTYCLLAIGDGLTMIRKR